MITLESHAEKGKKYFFEGFGFEKEDIEKGDAHPKAKGKVVSSLEINTNTNDYIYDEDLKKILEDCCPIVMTQQGIRATISYVEALNPGPDGKMYKKDNRIYVHTIEEPCQEGKER